MSGGAWSNSRGGFDIRVTKETASEKLRAAMARVADLKPLMERFGQHMMPSVRKNFDVGGRPTWKALQSVRVVLLGRARKNQRKQGRIRMGGPLVLTGDLRNHIGYRAEKQDLQLYARPSQDAVKAPVHQYGAVGAGKNHNVNIPARPYLVFQREDIAWFVASAKGWIRVGSLR